MGDGAGRRVPRLPHHPALDGLRGAAIVGVLLFHAGHLRGGFLGVDLFFVLSGFLITGLLLAEHRATGAISLRHFWSRRIRRLLPALVVVVAVVAAAGTTFVPASRLGELRADGLASLFYVANWRAIAAATDYWDAFSRPSPFEHTWSLAIEEQLYVLWPLIVFGVLRWGRERWLQVVTVLLAVASVVQLVRLFDPLDPARSYFGTDTRLAAPLYGATLALLLTGRRRDGESTPERVLGAAALGAVALLAWFWSTSSGTDAALYRWQLPVAGLAGALLVAASSSPRRGVIRRLLEVPVLRHLGQLSYGLYLVHWPVFVLLDEDRVGLSGWALTAVRVGASLALAELSLYLVERPVRSGQVPTRPWTVLATGGAAAAVGLLVLLPGRAPERRELVLPPPSTTVPGAAAPEPRDVLLVGDSGAALIGDELAEVGEPMGFDVDPEGEVGCNIVTVGGGAYTEDGTAKFLPDPEGCDEWPDRWRQLVTTGRPDAVVLLLAWPGIGERVIDGDRVHPCDATFDEYYAGRLGEALDVLGGSGAVVHVVSSSPVLLPGYRERIGCLNDVAAAEVAARPNARFLDLASWACPDGECRTSIDGIELREDGVHFDGDGGRLAAAWLLERLETDTAGP